MNWLILTLGLIPSFAWLVFYLEEDPHPEPKKLILETFLAGAAVTFIVLGLQILFSQWELGRGISEYGFFSLFGLAGIEETFKFFAAYLVVSHHARDFDEPVDAMIYMVVAALGFATVENIAAAFNAQNLFFETASLRFIGATLLHTLSSGMLGYFWARSLVFKRRILFWEGLGFAILLHTLFNYLIIVFEPVVIPTVFLIILALFVLHDFEELKHTKVKPING